MQPNRPTKNTYNITFEHQILPLDGLVLRDHCNIIVFVSSHRPICVITLVSTELTYLSIFLETKLTCRGRIFYQKSNPILRRITV